MIHDMALVIGTNKKNAFHFCLFSVVLYLVKRLSSTSVELLPIHVKKS